MQIQPSNHVLDPYKTIGCFVNGPVAVSQSHPFTIAAVSNNSFKIYSHELGIKVVSPCFQDNITSVSTFNEFTYVRVKDSVFKMRYHHIVEEWKVNSKEEQKNKKEQKTRKSSMLRFDEIILLGEDNCVTIIDQQSGQLSKIQLQYEIIKIIHPVSYINKIISYGQKNMTLLNVVSGNILYEFPNLIYDLAENGQTIALIQPTKSVNFVAIATSSGKIIIYNIKTDKAVFTMKQKKPATAIAFSADHPFMLTTDSSGKILLWDYENGKILYRLEQALDFGIDFACFVDGYPLIICTSSEGNQIKQFRINKEENKVLTLFRERCGSNEIIERFKIHNDKEITFSSKKKVVFTSLYSHCNNYIVKDQLDSFLPYHIVRHHFTVQIYKNQTIIGSMNIHQQPENACISMSKKYCIITTKSKLIKMTLPSEGSNLKNSCSILQEWKIPNIQQTHLFYENLIYAFCSECIYVLDFNSEAIFATLNSEKQCLNGRVNYFGNLLALENRTDQTIEIWNMQKKLKGRSFASVSPAICLAFSSDNRYLISSHSNNKLLVWNIADNEIYKSVKVFEQIRCMAFTPDNNYFLSVFKNSKEVNIWHNYIGKITTNRNEEEVGSFTTKMKKMERDYRMNFYQKPLIKEEIEEQKEIGFEQLLQQIQDPQDDTWHYDFTHVNKWMPLVHYDQIKARNTIETSSNPTDSIPFFMDFSNIDEQKKKILSEVQAQKEKKKKQNTEKRNKLLQNDEHQITLSENSTDEQYEKTFKMLSSLNIAEIDYQMRKYLLLPLNCLQLAKMFILLGNKKIKNRQIYNIMLVRFLDIVGSQICDEDLKPVMQELLEIVDRQAERQGELINGCLAVVQNYDI